MGFCEISYGFDICEKKHLERAFRLGDSRTCKNEDRTLKNLVMAYNESRDYSAFTQIFSPMVDSYIENNTIIRTVEHPDIESNVFREHDPNNQAIDSPTKYRNNLVVLVSEKTRKGVGNQVYLGWPMAEFNHSNNLFFNLDAILRMSSVQLGIVKSIITSVFLKASFVLRLSFIPAIFLLMVLFSVSVTKLKSLFALTDLISC